MKKFQPMPTAQEFRAMLPKDRRKYVNSLDDESRAAFFRSLASEPPKTFEQSDAKLQGMDYELRRFRDLIEGRAHGDTPDELAGLEADICADFAAMPPEKRMHLICLWSDYSQEWLMKEQRRHFDHISGATMKRIEATAERAAQEAERAADLISTLRTEWLTGEKKAPASRIEIVGTVKMRIYDLWEEYKAQHDPCDNGGRKADYSTFYEFFGGREICHGSTLQIVMERQAQVDAKRRTPEELIKRIIKTERQSRANRATKDRQKPKSSQKAKHK